MGRKSFCLPLQKTGEVMRALIVILLLVVVLGLVGWVQFSSPDGDPTIRVDTDKVKRDTAEVVDKSKQVFDDVTQEVDEAMEPNASAE